MMMEKPRPTTQEETPAVENSSTSSKASNAVEDLEKRLAMLDSGTSNDPPPPLSAAMSTTTEPSPSFASSSATSSAKTGKNALLARIMAAQERAKQAQKAPSNGPVDLLSGNDDNAQTDDPPPAFDSAFAPAPPPAFDSAALPAPSATMDAPPPFEAVQDSVFPAAPPAMTADPPSMFAPPPPMPSAPAFEDLMDGHHQPNQQMPPPPMPPPPAPTMVALDPPAADAAADCDFSGLEGLSEEERNALLEEQRQIMEQIEKQKSQDQASEAVARAEAFDQRSNTAAAAAVASADGRASATVNLGSGAQNVALHGQERTKQAIKDGTAIMVACVNCQNWMQVTDSASLMFCPVCQVVSPVDRDSAVLTKEEAMQMEADRKMAEQLQNEEYKKAGRDSEREARAASRQQQQQEEKSGSAGGWMEWLGLSASSSSKPVRPTIAPPRPAQRGELGVSRPPGAGSGSLSPARTGEETITFSNSYDEQEGLMGGGRAAAATTARVAEQKPLFSCVADSISTAATSLSTALNTQTLHEDSEGNIHGVDASGLLAVSQVSRNNTSGYESLPTNNSSP